MEAIIAAYRSASSLKTIWPPQVTIEWARYTTLVPDNGDLRCGEISELLPLFFSFHNIII